jgi:hypothetical protein
MRPPREWLDRLWSTIRPNRRDAELEQELRLHLELAAEDARQRAHACSPDFPHAFKPRSSTSDRV